MQHAGKTKAKDINVEHVRAIGLGHGVVAVPGLCDSDGVPAYQYPPRDAGAELSTLCVHVALHEQACSRWSPDLDKLAQAIRRTYVNRPVDASMASILECSEAASSDSGPGQPWLLTGCKSKEEILSDPALFALVWSVVYDRLTLLLGLSDEELEWYRRHPTAAVRDGVRDFAKIFIKNEPHKVGKIAEGRLRIIVSLSIADYLLERLLWHRQLKTEQDNLYAHGNLVGIGFTADHAERFTASIARAMVDTGCHDLWSIDAKAWDWSLVDRASLMEVEAYNDIAGGSAALARLRRAHQLTVLTHSYALRDGKCYEVGHKYGLASGMMTSGRLRTAHMNSTLATAYAYYAGAESAWAMGDDCLALARGSLTGYEALGPRLGDSIRYDARVDTFEFCKHHYQLAQPESIYMDDVSKSVCQFIANGYTEERHASLTESFRARSGHATRANLDAIAAIVRGSRL